MPNRNSSEIGAPGHGPATKIVFPLNAFLVTAFAPAISLFLVTQFYDHFTDALPSSQMFRLPQIIGFGVMGIGCAVHAGFLLGRGGSEWRKLAGLLLASALIGINLLCTAIVAFYIM